MPTVTQREAARRDLIEHFVHLAENAGLDTAERFLDHAKASFDDLARQPGMGAPLRLKHPDLATIRKWRIKGFDNHLVFSMSRDPMASPSCACCTRPAIGGICSASRTHSPSREPLTPAMRPATLLTHRSV